MARSGTGLEAHERTYGSFLKMLRYGAVAVFVVVAAVVLIIAH
ncbi:aa3-type cytochrome c oxidase subunit IV [Sphingomonas morindae]|uniref:Aa3-type cytochrome c oxidase subunit IV n=1 Tax=Sphingomonas morindae TaxID=1541170 RepID=A0ABY4X663_9SPHN|nr:aa3-type cytochrome c oxidase subunit IV [Sphingomonas morindae]USI72385.1 aa3-type cytochrome c oxidase subunit IV [Sphingomonas morindae]